MKKAILGRKIGMTQLFGDKGEAIPVTVVEAGPCTVVEKKSVETHGYNAIQIGYGYEGAQDQQTAPGPFQQGRAQAEKIPAEFPWRIWRPIASGRRSKRISFQYGEKIDVVATSKGKGFAGSIKRHNQHRGPMSHGSRYHRGPGSLGGVDAARVFKGQPCRAAWAATGSPCKTWRWPGYMPTVILS
jgi:large subunit ribosomal protein L3